MGSENNRSRSEFIEEGYPALIECVREHPEVEFAGNAIEVPLLEDPTFNTLARHLNVDIEEYQNSADPIEKGGEMHRKYGKHLLEVCDAVEICGDELNVHNLDGCRWLNGPEKITIRRVGAYKGEITMSKQGDGYQGVIKFPACGLGEPGMRLRKQIIQVLGDDVPYYSVDYNLLQNSTNTDNNRVVHNGEYIGDIDTIIPFDKDEFSDLLDHFVDITDLLTLFIHRFDGAVGRSVS